MLFVIICVLTIASLIQTGYPTLSAQRNFKAAMNTIIRLMGRNTTSEFRL